MNIIPCTFEQHGEPILEILNAAIVHSTALYDYKERTMSDMKVWFATKTNHQFPVLGLVDPSTQELLGFTSYGAFRSFPANKYTAEHSVYVAQKHRGLGYGELLLRRIVQEAQANQKHTLIGAIDSTNYTSIALHKKLGFETAGVIQHAGFKFGRWLDLTLMQIIFSTPNQPIDG
jgi:L-amino acid N-acyltransferase